MKEICLKIVVFIRKMIFNTTFFLNMKQKVDLNEFQSKNEFVSLSQLDVIIIPNDIKRVSAS